MQYLFILKVGCLVHRDKFTSVLHGSTWTGLVTSSTVLTTVLPRSVASLVMSSRNKMGFDEDSGIGSLGLHACVRVFECANGLAGWVSKGACLRVRVRMPGHGPRLVAL